MNDNKNIDSTIAWTMNGHRLETGYITHPRDYKKGILSPRIRGEIITTPKDA
jgi:hypothetical protein